MGNIIYAPWRYGQRYNVNEEWMGKHKGLRTLLMILFPIHNTHYPLASTPYSLTRADFAGIIDIIHLVGGWFCLVTFCFQSLRTNICIYFMFLALNQDRNGEVDSVAASGHDTLGQAWHMDTGYSESTGKEASEGPQVGCVVTNSRNHNESSLSHHNKIVIRASYRNTSIHFIICTEIESLNISNSTST